MSSFLDSAAVLTSVKAVYSISIFGAACSIIISIMASYFALRAKSRARDELQRLEALKSLIAIVGANRNGDVNLEKITHDQWKEIRILIEQDIEKLPPRDRKYIKQGLRQSDERGAQRYAKDILGA